MGCRGPYRPPGSSARVSKRRGQRKRWWRAADSNRVLGFMEPARCHLSRPRYQVDPAGEQEWRGLYRRGQPASDITP